MQISTLLVVVSTSAFDFTHHLYQGKVEDSTILRLDKEEFWSELVSYFTGGKESVKQETERQF